MRSCFAFLALAVATFTSCQASEAQGRGSSLALELHTELNCPPPQSTPSSGVAIKIGEVTFEGAASMPASDQEQIADSIKSSTFSGEVDAITSGIEERVRRAWQQRGYMEVRVSSHSEALNGDLTEKRLAVAFSVDEGRQYRLGGMVFKRAKLPIDEKSLRNLFPIQDGDIFNSAAVADGLQALSDIYRQIGYINFTSVPEMRFDDEAGTVWLDLDLDEGKQFRISTIGVIGLDQVASQQALRELLLRPGDIYNQELMETSIQKLSSSSFSVGSEKRILNEKAGTVAITVSFRHCGQ